VKRYNPKKADDEELLKKDIIRLAEKHPRYGYRRITAMLEAEGWRVNRKRVQRIWRELGLRVPKKQKKRRRVHLWDGSCISLKPLYQNHVWSYDFVDDRTSDGRKYKCLTIMDEFTKESLKIKVKRSIKSQDVLEALSELFLSKGIPDFIRSDNGPEFIANAVKKFIKDVGAKTMYINPGCPWENPYIERFNGTLKDELLDREIFHNLKEAEAMIENYRIEYNRVRPHSALDYKTPEAFIFFIQNASNHMVQKTGA
jgi:transposase InsO family protein